jgi:hypothetical protein
MTPPEHGLPKSRRQILNDETEKAERLHARGNEHTIRSLEDTWVRSFIDRLAGLVRTIGGKK